MFAQAHIFSPMYPSFSAMGCKGGDSSCRKKHDHDEMGCGDHPDEEVMGCKKCDAKKMRRIHAQVITLEGGPYPVMNRLLGTPRHNHNPRLGQLTCPAQAPALDPTLNCQRDARGNAVCSNGMHFPPGCPHTPPEEYFSPGIAPDEVHGGIIEARIPPPREAGSAGAAGVPSAPGAAPAPAAGGTSPIVPVAAIGGVAAIAAFFLLR